MADRARSGLLVIVIACAVAVLARATSAQGPAETPPPVPVTSAASPVVIGSPSPDAYLSGPTPLRATIDPSLAVRNVTFFVDGRQLCSLPEQPFECVWDAGSTI